MALVKCPECGREKVSDSAEMCPDCGYGIKAYYARQREVEYAKKQREQKIAKVTMPSPPSDKMDSNEKGLLGFGIVAAVCGVILLPGEGAFLGVCCLITGIGFIFVAFSQDSKNKEVARRNYELALKDFEEYQKSEVARQERIEARRRAELENAIKCPVCNSINVEKITAVDRSVSIAAVGLASGKIGKQYKCKNCKHMW